jgi:glycerate kinase
MVYSPQKGACKETVRKLESDMHSYADLCERFTGRVCRDLPGAGAAGGTGFAFMTFLNAEISPGWKFLFETAGIEKEIENCDLVITGEGFVDNQSFSGKLLSGVLSLAEKYSKRVWVFCAGKHSDKHKKN